MQTQNSLSDGASSAECEQPAREVVELDVLYAEPSSMIQKAVSRHLTEYHRAYLEIATFFCLATGRGDSGLDASPRGGSERSECHKFVC
ncbi:hypothetical protein NU688_07370 [Variovorax sp. ZS18.2.2]|uniref:hypothetical protein n=1 Tax=Variovorax sp. ZS18.2.2 TaxID=2971255 RepID=UPI0021514C42|nr:hypothetical protein [Variovorax sp. ZS18.2.2]MCR6475970.1 hypothetical protein [Variovorax sp. ZS18.2.2]